MSAVAVPGGSAGGRADRHALPAPAVRLWALAAMALLAAMQWGVLLAPSPRGRLALCVVIAVAAAATARRAGGLPRRARLAADLGTGVGAAAAVLVAAGVPLRLLDPRGWGGLASSLEQGVQALPTIGVPYRGVDPWTRIVLIACGGLLLVLAAGLAVRALRRERRPLVAALVLSAAYAIPVVERPPGHPFLWGAVLTVLLGALLWGDRIERGHAAAATAFVAAALAGGLMLSPRLDAAEPLIDYQAVVDSLSTPPSVGFAWDHGYGPLSWPREDRVMLRVASEQPRYWKALDLATFDGTRWVTGGAVAPDGATEFARDHANWRVKLRFSVRDLRSPYYITAGTGLAVSHSPRFARSSGPGTFATGSEPLRRGDSYAAEAYVPDPSIRELRAAGTDYPPEVAAYLGARIGSAQIEFPQFSVLSVGTPPSAMDAAGERHTDGVSLLASSPYASTFRLARRMRAASSTPYDYVRAVQARLARGYAYTEKPPAPRAGRPPLVSFLFDTRAGYCQQFSGAMALLLRMGGVPARVSAGFAPGTFDEDRGEWVVRDVDAHSWVEAYFPRIGWVTFDPTPGVAPPRTQLLNGPAPVGGRDVPLRPQAERPKPAPRSAGGGAVRARDGGGPSPWAVVLGVLAGGALAAAATVAARRRGARSAEPGDLGELERALRLTGRPPEPRLTLRALERRFAGHAPDAAAYVAAVRLARYAGHPAAPTPRQRAALREVLAEGLGWRGRVRAWWALPPARPRF